MAIITLTVSNQYPELFEVIRFSGYLTEDDGITPIIGVSDAIDIHLKDIGGAVINTKRRNTDETGYYQWDWTVGTLRAVAVQSKAVVKNVVTPDIPIFIGGIAPPDPVPDPIPDPVPDPIPDPVPDPIPDPVPDPIPDPVPEPPFTLIPVADDFITFLKNNSVLIAAVILIFLLIVLAFVWRGK